MLVFQIEFFANVMPFEPNESISQDLCVRDFGMILKHVRTPFLVNCSKHAKRKEAIGLTWKGQIPVVSLRRSELRKDGGSHRIAGARRFVGGFADLDGQFQETPEKGVCPSHDGWEDL
jgi:hypothetical protein